MRFFGSSGIRGIVNEKITPDFVLKVGKALGRENDRIIVGRDPRPSGHMVKSALTAGLTAQGSDVHSAGIVPTPTVAYNTEYFDCGVMITASHNPAPYNGIKFWNPDGSAFDTPQMKKLERSILTGPELPPWDEVGTSADYKGAIEEHKRFILDRFGDDHSTKVVIDCANGAACSTTPFLLREMGCSVRTLNSNPDGSFPAHPPEPVEENLTDLQYLVKNTDAELGIAHDGDADRMVAFDKEGNYLGGDKLLALFASQFKKKAVVPVNSSMVIEELVDEVIRTKVGDIFVAEELKRHGAEFGGEPSGTWIFPEISFAPDAIFAAAFLVDMCERCDLTEKISELPSYPTRRRSYTVENKVEIMEELKEGYMQDHEEGLDLVDGIRLDLEDGWCLTRASGTEPKIRITAEAKDDERLKGILNIAEERLKEVMR